MLGGADGPGLVRVEQHDIGVGAHRDRALAREQAEEFCGRRRRQLDIAVERHAVAPHAAVVDQRHARLEARRAVGDLAEVVPAELLGEPEPQHILAEAERAVIGGDDLEVVGLEPAPERMLVRRAPERWRHHELRCLEARPVVLLFGEEEIVRAGLGMDGEPAVPRFRHRVERLARREVHDIDRRLGELRDADDPVGRLALHQGGPGQHVPLGARIAGGERLLHQHVDDVAVLGVDLHHPAVRADLTHRLEDRPVVDHQQVGIGGEELEGGDAFVVDQALHVDERLVVHLGHDHVRTDIDGGDRGALVPVGKAFERARALHLGGEVHDGGGAAEGPRLGAGVEGVRRARRPEVPVEVRVHIDAAGQYEQPRRILLGNPLADREIGADHAHPPVLHQDVGLVVVHRGHDPPVPNNGPTHPRLPGASPAPLSLPAIMPRRPSPVHGPCACMRLFPIVASPRPEPLDDEAVAVIAASRAADP